MSRELGIPKHINNFLYQWAGFSLGHLLLCDGYHASVRHSVDVRHHCTAKGDHSMVCHGVLLLLFQLL